MKNFPPSIVCLNTVLDDISTTAKSYIAVPAGCEGDVIEIRSVISSAIATSDTLITGRINNTLINGGVLVIPFTGSSGGDTAVANTISSRTVSGGDNISVESNGATTTAAKCWVTVVIKRS